MMVIYFETVEIQISDILQVLSNLGFIVQNVNLQITIEEFQCLCAESHIKIYQNLKE